MKRIICITVILSIILILIGIYYFITRDTFFENESYKIKPSKISEKLYQNSKIITEELSDDIVQHLIVKVNNNWYEIASQTDVDNDFVIIGEKDNIFYYADSNGIKYVDLTNDNYKSVSYFILKSNECKNNIEQGFIYNDDIYLSISTSCNQYKLSSFSIKTGKIKTLIKNIGSNFHMYNGNIYYLDYSNSLCNGNALFSYNLRVKNSKQLSKDVCFFDANKNKILFNKLDSSSKESKYLVYLYDTDTDSNKYITDGISLSVYDDVLFYSKDSKVFKYINSNSSVIYDGSSDNSLFEGVKILDKNRIIISLGDDDKYILNDKVVSEDVFKSSFKNFKVNMKDGSSKKFSLLDTIS